MSQYLKEFSQRYKGFLKRSRSLITTSDWHLKKHRKNFGHVEANFRHACDATMQVVNGIDEFISGVKGERENVGVQTYINTMVDIVYVHLDRITDYYDNNNPDSHQKNEDKRREESFQNLMFQEENKIRTKLNKLNVNNDLSNFELPLHSDKLVSLMFKDIVEESIEGVSNKISSLNVDWDLTMDNGFYINIPKTKRPRWNRQKHFFDQDEKVLQFYVSEWNKITRGVEIDGYYFHPWLYFHLNYFKANIPEKNEFGVIKEVTKNPMFRRNEWYFTEIIKQAERDQRGAIFIFGTRRFGKSILEASFLLWKAITSPNSEVSVTISNDIDRHSITSKIEFAMRHMHAFIRCETNKDDWESLVELGFKTKKGERLTHCFIRITNTSSGSKKATQKGAGGAPVAYIYDESGKADFIDGWNAAKFSFKTPYGWKAIPIFTGTGSNADISADAEKVLNNPDLYDFMPMDWDLLEYGIPPEAITWKRRKFAFFVPAQMSYEEGMQSIKMPFSKFIDKPDSELLKKIEFYDADWIANSKFLLEEQEKLKRSNRSEYQSYCVFLPTDPEHCLMSAKTNPFPVAEAKKHKERLTSKGNDDLGTALAVTLHREQDGRIVPEMSNKPVASYPHSGGFVDAPILLFGELPTEKPLDYEYVAGLDDYRHEESDGDSVGVLTIYKRGLGLSKDDGKIVATLATRPDPHDYLHQQIHLLLDAFNAKCFPENADMDIKKYFDKMGLSFRYLVAGFDIMDAFAFKHTGKRKYGWTPDKNTAPFVRGLVLDYCNEIIEIKDEDGNIIETKKGVERIDDIHLLDEIIQFKEDGNFDRIVSFGSALFYEHFLTHKMQIYPKKRRQHDEDYENQPRPQVRNKRALLRNRKRNLFKG